MARSGTDQQASEARHLRPETKRRTLEEWDLSKSGPLPAAGRGLGGRGYPDPDMICWCDHLNAIPGVCTLQSCAGHGPEDSGGGMKSGHLWLLLDEAMSDAFDTRALDLASETEHIERVSRIYSPWGQEVTSIVFAGNERGLLAESMRIVLDFFRTLREERQTREREG